MVGALVLLLPAAAALTQANAEVAPSSSVASAATAAANIVPPTITPNRPIVGERFAVAGALGQRGRSAVQLQRRTDGHWKVVRRTTSRRNGRYEMFYATSRHAVTLRVTADPPRSETTLVSPRQRVRTVEDRSTLVVTGTSETATAQAQSFPARPGRHVRLEVRGSDGVWSPAAPREVQDSDGRTTYALAGVPATPHRYRLRVAAWHGAPAYVGGTFYFAPDGPSWAVPATPEPLAIATEGGADIVSKEDYLAGTMVLDGVTHPIQIRGRGNSTWLWEKKPYKVKLATATSLLGMPEERDWVLLANWADRSALRNQLALSFGAARTSLAWTPHVRYVDVTLNGEPVGLYQLVEQVEQSDARVVLPDDGMLLEIDRKAEANLDPFFWSPHHIPVAYNDPDDPTVDQQTAVQQAVADLEAALYGADFADPATGYAAHLDLASFVDWYLLSEFFANHDSRFYSSVMVTWVPGEKFTMGPPWDFDLSAGSGWFFTMPAEGWWTRKAPDNWYARLVEDPAFEARLASRWAELRPAFAALVEQIPAAAAALQPYVAADWTLWHEDDSHDDLGQIHAADYDGEVAFLQQWFTTRLAWLDVQFGTGT